jgi:hypothetical protein
MTDLEGMHSYFWLTSSRLREPIQDDVPYTTQALRQDLNRVRNAWDECQSSRDRNAIYIYLSAVFDLVMWWAAEGRAVSRARWALQLQHLHLPTTDEPFATIILATADRQKVDKRTRSKWSRVLRYAMEYKTSAEPLAAFVRRKGGINKCAARFTRCLGMKPRLIYKEHPSRTDILRARKAAEAEHDSAQPDDEAANEAAYTRRDCGSR